MFKSSTRFIKIILTSDELINAVNNYYSSLIPKNATIQSQVSRADFQTTLTITFSEDI